MYFEDNESCLKRGVEFQFNDARLIGGIDCSHAYISLPSSPCLPTLCVPCLFYSSVAPWRQDYTRLNDETEGSRTGLVRCVSPPVLQQPSAPFSSFHPPPSGSPTLPPAPLVFANPPSCSLLQHHDRLISVLWLI